MLGKSTWTRRNILKTLVLGTGMATLPATCTARISDNIPVECPTIAQPPSNNSSRRPNVIVFYLDDLDEDEIAVTRGKVLTPNIDCLAKGGMQFKRAYITSPVCTPSRYSLLTGEFASRSRALRQHTGPVSVQWNTPLIAGDSTIASVLKQNGYTTGMVGKWHLGESPTGKSQPFELSVQAKAVDPSVLATLRDAYDQMRQVVKDYFGFDYVESFYAENIDVMHKKWGMPKALNFHNMEWITQGALNFIEQSKDKPFFLYFATTLPHSPNMLKSLKGDPRVTPIGFLDQAPQVQPSRRSIFQRVKQAGLSREAAPFTWLDDGVGAVLNKLDELGLAEDTVVFFLSDHQSGGKFTLYEAGTKIPCFLNWRRKIPAGSQCDSLVANIDVAPTIFDICDVTPPEDFVLDGKSWRPLFQSEQASWRDSLLLEIGYARGVVTKDWKYIAVRYPEEIQRVVDASDRQNFGWDGQTKIRYSVNQRFPGYFDYDQLYDLITDPQEQKNLAKVSEYKVTLQDMQFLLKEHLQALPHPFGEFK